MFLRKIVVRKLPLFRISRSAFALFLSRVHMYTPSSHDEISLRICDPIGNIYYKTSSYLLVRNKIFNFVATKPFLRGGQGICRFLLQS